MYHFGVSNELIWISHILIGIFLVYVGYQVLNNKPLHQIVSLALIVTGVLAALYHLHLWHYNSSHDHTTHHDSLKKIITTFNGEKYDLTDYQLKHPGGGLIKKAAGKDLAEAWKQNGVSWHLKNPRVMNVLKKYKM